MSISIVVGGQYGSEGKGKVAYYWAKRMDAAAVVRVGGSNSGHTIYDKEQNRFAFRMLPTASVLDDIATVLPAGSYIDISVLRDEIKLIGISEERLKIDHNAVIITDKDKIEEKNSGLRREIGSTLSGTGAAVLERVKRNINSNITLARDVEELRPYLTDTKTFMHELLKQGKHIVIEGTQGYGLSNYHAKAYPYATSRDTTAAGFLAETGLGPLSVEYVIMVIRTFPIRVAGNSGPLVNEIDWETVAKESGSKIYFEEKTTVTQMVRRVARFDEEIVKEAIIANAPNIIVLNHLDYVDYDNKGNNQLTEKQRKFVREIEKKIGQSIDYCGNGEMSFIEMKGMGYNEERRG